MRALSRLFIGVTCVLGLVAPARALAQDAAPVEIGIGLSGLMTTPYEDFFTNDFAAPAFDVRGTVRLSPRFSFDAGIGVGRRTETDIRRTRTEGMYSFMLTQRLRSATRGQFHVFLSYGLAGYYARVHQPVGQALQPNGQTIPYPAFTFTEWEQPIATLVGAGMRHTISPHLAVRAEAQMVSLFVLPLGVRLAGSVCIPIGR